MRAVVQRVTGAQVAVGDRVTGEIGPGLLVFVGVEKGDTHSDVEYIAGKIRDLRIFEDGGEPPRMNRSVADCGGSVLVVSQFTLLADARKGRRPSFDDAAEPDVARTHYEAIVRELRASGLTVATGEFRAMMRVRLENDGPVTILLDSRRRF
jgi:D-tyrosyl-tRNA(Tyr) deacylase